MAPTTHEITTALLVAAAGALACDGAAPPTAPIEEIDRLGYPIIDHFSFDDEGPGGSTRRRYSVLGRDQVPAYELAFLAQQCPWVEDMDAYLTAHWGTLFDPANHKFVGRRFEIYDAVRDLGTVKHICERHEEVSLNHFVPTAEGGCLRGGCLYVDNTANTLKNRGLFDPDQAAGDMGNVRFTTGEALTILAWVRFDYRRVDTFAGRSQLLLRTGELGADLQPGRNHVSFSAAYDTDPSTVRLDLSLLDDGPDGRPPTTVTRTFTGVDTGDYILVAAAMARRGARIESRVLVGDDRGVQASDATVLEVAPAETFLQGPEATTTFLTGLDRFCGWFDELTLVGQALDAEDVARFHALYKP
ncbi:MAG: hypothetical protein ABIO70_01160 [Pseudomonadota bacterium]